jgi:DNA-binding NarL/FixJ family response regulator
VLKKMREEVDTRFVPVVIVTSSNHPQGVRRAYEMRAKGYLDKLSDGLPWHEGVRTMACYWAGMNLTPYLLVG